MADKFDVVFNSETDNAKGYFQIASGYISETRIHFEKEHIVAVVHAKGCVEFYDMENKLLASGAVPQAVSGKEAYEEISCQAENGKIVLQFPIYQWIDNYPHCDGEHDRWDTRKVGAHTMIFDACAKTVVCS